MIKFGTFDATSSRPSIGDETLRSNFAVIVPADVFKSVNNSTLIDIHVRQAIQNRPYFYFRGAAERTMLQPMASLLAKKGDPISFMLQFAKDLNAVSKGVSLARSKASVSAIASVYSSLLPSTKIAGEFERPISEPGSSPRTGLQIFSNFFADLMTNAKSRQTILKTFKTPDVAIKPAVPATGDVTTDTISEVMSMLEVFGMAGKSQPLFGDDITPILASRFTIENYIFSDPGPRNTKYEEDCRIAAALWYLMYNQVVQTPESYDSAMPLVPPSPQDAQIASQIQKMLGTFIHTSIATATAPIYLDAMIALKQFRELYEFLMTGPTFSLSSSEKITEALNRCEDKITEGAYAPIVTLAKSSFDYVKKLTHARYLLPDFIIKYVSTTDESPFSPMVIPADITPPAKYMGYMSKAQRVTAFGGLDVPQLLENLKRRIFDLESGLMQLSQLRTTLQSGMSSIPSTTVTHLDSLGALEADPALGDDNLHYPSLTRTYLAPTYVPKYSIAANRVPRWIFADDYMYKPFFSTGFQLQQLTRNSAQQFFSWDTEVALPPSPATGAEFATLMIPYEYTYDVSAQSIVNDIASVDQFLSSSPHRPMKELANYFVPLFRALSTGLNEPSVIANAIASMFSIYKRKGSTKASSFNQASAWALVKPQIPFIYGYPTDTLMEANAPWTDDERFKCDLSHTITSSDGEFMLVLHRALPKPMSLTYIPFTMAGGIKVSLPVSSAVYAKCLTEIASPEGSPDKFYSNMFKQLSKASVDNGLVKVTAWAPVYATFPHIFVTNRHIMSAASQLLASAPKLLQRMTLVSDDAAPFGGVLSFYTSPLIAFDLIDQDEALTSNETVIDIGEAVKSKASKGKVEAPESTPPKSSFSDEKPLNTVTETEATPPSETTKTGENKETKAPNVGSFNPEDVVEDK